MIRSLTLDDPEPYTGDTVVVTVDATDPDGDPLTYSWTVPDLVDSAGATATWRPETAQTYTIVVSVEDDLGGTAEESTTVTVIDPAPVTTAEPVEQPDAAVIPSEDADQIDARPDDAVIPSEDADQSDARPDEPSEAEAEAGGTPSDSTPTSSTTSGSKSKGWSATVWLILFLGLAGGAVGVWIALKGAIMLRGGRGPNPLLTKPNELARAIEKEWQEGVTDPDPSFIEYEEDRQEERRRIETLTLPASAPPPIASPPQASAPVSPPISTPTPVSSPSTAAAPFTPRHEVVVEGESEYGRAPGHHLDGKGRRCSKPAKRSSCSRTMASM